MPKINCVFHEDKTASLEIYTRDGDMVYIDHDNLALFNKYTWRVTRAGYLARIKRTPKSNKSTTEYFHKAILDNVPILIDHINGNKIDNRKINLRFATKSTNAANSKKRLKDTAVSKYKGVSLWKSPYKSRLWRARITCQGREIGLGYFKEEKQAAIAYDTGAKKYFGDYARLNFPEES